MSEKPARLSVMSLAATVSALGVRAGEVLQALIPPLLPAATAYTTPLAIDAVNASSSAWNVLPPRLMFATAGLMACAVTQSTPAIT